MGFHVVACVYWLLERKGIVWTRQMTARSTVRVYFFAKLYIALTAGKVPFAKLYIEPPVSCTETAVAGFTRFRRETLCETPRYARGPEPHEKPDLFRVYSQPRSVHDTVLGTTS